MRFGRAFHRVAADVPISRLPYRIVLLLLGTSGVATKFLEVGTETNS